MWGCARTGNAREHGVTNTQGVRPRGPRWAGRGSQFVSPNPPMNGVADVVRAHLRRVELVDVPRVPAVGLAHGHVEVARHLGPQCPRAHADKRPRPSGGGQANSGEATRWGGRGTQRRPERRDKDGGGNLTKALGPGPKRDPHLVNLHVALDVAALTLNPQAAVLALDGVAQTGNIPAPHLVHLHEHLARVAALHKQTGAQQGRSARMWASAVGWGQAHHAQLAKARPHAASGQGPEGQGPEGPGCASGACVCGANGHRTLTSSVSAP